MKRKIARVLLVFALGFSTLFALRIAVGYSETPSDTGGGLGNAFGRFDNNNDNSGFFSNSRKNYFSGKSEMTKAAIQAANPSGTGGGDTKYEKVARLAAGTSDFPQHERALRGSIQQHKAIVQAEESSGLAGRRYLHLSIGVPPQNFEAMLEQVRSIGTLTSIQVNKTDKTNEYKDLNAHRVSLEKSRDALIALKTRSAGSGKVDELINLENKILETEENIQKLGVRLGEFDGENEFVTIQFALTEQGAKPTISFGYRAKVAFQWTVKWYLAMLGLLLLASICALVLVSIAERLKWIPEAIRKAE